MHNQQRSRARWRRYVQRLKTDILALWLAGKHPRVPWYARLVVVGVVAYAWSPIDLIPDFIPILGHLDDLVLLPAGLVLALRLIPPDILAECRREAQAVMAGKQPISRVAGVIIVAIWLSLAATAVGFMVR